MPQRGSPSGQLADGDYERMALWLRRLANTNTLRLIEAMGKGEWKVTALAERAGIPQPLASRHLISLARGGIMTRRPQGKNVFYKICDDDALDMCKLMRKRATQDPPNPRLSDDPH